MVKFSVNRYVSQRIETVISNVEDGTKRLRNKALRTLEEIFIMAGKIARGKIKHQRINGKMVPITLKQRRRWLQVAAHAAETIQSISTNFDEQETHDKLKELEKLVNIASTREERNSS